MFSECLALLHATVQICGSPTKLTAAMTGRYSRLIYGGILRIVAQYSPWIIILESMSFLDLNYVSIHCHAVISKDLRFRLIKQLRPDTLRFTDRRFQNRVRINGTNLRLTGQI